jgi:hypothetical protein
MRTKQEIETMLIGLKEDITQAREWVETAQKVYKSNLSFYGKADKGEVLSALDLACNLDSQKKILEWVLCLEEVF